MTSPKDSRTVLSPNLDILRAIAVLAVLVSHLLEAMGIDNTGSLGRFGVIIFFVHTSFVLMASLERLEASGLRPPRRLVEAFWMRRFFRIYPLAVFFISTTAIFQVPRNPGLTYHWIGVKAFFSNLALMENLTYSPDILAPLWSLPLEVQMYGMLPFLYLAVRKHTRFGVWAIWAISIPLALTLPRLSGRLGVFLYAPCFLSGIVAYDLLRNPQHRRRMPWWLWPAGILAAIAAFGPFDELTLDDKIYRAWILSLGLGVLYANVQESPVNYVQRIFHWIAEHSYGIYLSHIVLIWIAFYPMASVSPWVRAVVLAAMMIAVPAILYRTIERPFILFGNRFARSTV